MNVFKKNIKPLINLRIETKSR